MPPWLPCALELICLGFFIINLMLRAKVRQRFGPAFRPSPEEEEEEGGGQSDSPILEVMYESSIDLGGRAFCLVKRDRGLPWSSGPFFNTWLSSIPPPHTPFDMLYSVSMRIEC